MNSNKVLAGVLIVAALISSAGCSSTTKTTTGKAGLSQGVNHPSASDTPSESATDQAIEDPTTESDSASPSPTEAAPQKFGTRFTYEDGLVVSVARPVIFHPSEYAAKEKAHAYVVLKVTVINGTGKRYDPSVFNTSVQSSNVEGSSVYDSENGLEGAPSTSVLPGRETTFKVAFGVADPKDLVVEVTPGFEYEASIFTS